jgi:hypothetical protein
MQILPLSMEEAVKSGFTHKIIITHLDLVTETSGAACAIFPKFSDESVKTIPIGSRVRACAVRAVTLFVAASMTDLSITIGDGGSANRYLTTVEVGGTTSPITAGVWYETFAAAPFIYTAADTIDLVATATGAALSALTAGEMHVYLHVADMVSIDNGTQPAF